MAAVRKVYSPRGAAVASCLRSKLIRSVRPETTRQDQYSTHLIFTTAQQLFGRLIAGWSQTISGSGKRRGVSRGYKIKRVADWCQGDRVNLDCTRPLGAKGCSEFWREDIGRAVADRMTGGTLKLFRQGMVKMGRLDGIETDRAYHGEKRQPPAPRRRPLQREDCRLTSNNRVAPGVHGYLKIRDTNHDVISCQAILFPRKARASRSRAWA